MREANLDMWLVICQEDDYEPVFKTMVPLRTWAPILQILVFYDRGIDEGIERINLSMTDLGRPFAKPWNGRNHKEQLPLLAQIIGERDPKRIGINIGSIEWAAGGLTQNLYQQLNEVLVTPYLERLVSAEVACTRWLETLSDIELEYYPQVVRLTHQIIADCYNPLAITVGVTSTDDLQWAFWQTSQNLGLEQSFIPLFNLVRNGTQQALYGVDDKVIHPGDLIHCDVGNRYLRLCSDLQEWAYVRRPGEDDAPTGLKNLFTQVSRLQNVYLAEFKTGLTGNELLTIILQRSKAEGIPGPKVYSHSLGYYLREPGPLIGLPWEQERNPGRGDVPLVPNTVYTMELSIEDAVPEWNNQVVRLACEEDVFFTEDGCKVIDSRQTEFYLI